MRRQHFLHFLRLLLTSAFIAFLAISLRSNFDYFKITSEVQSSSRIYHKLFRRVSQHRSVRSWNDAPQTLQPDQVGGLDEGEFQDSNSEATDISGSESTSITEQAREESKNTCYQRGGPLLNAFVAALNSLTPSVCPSLRGWRYGIKSLQSLTSRFDVSCQPDHIMGILDQRIAASVQPPFQKICTNRDFHNFVQYSSQGLPAGSNLEFEYNNWYSAWSRAIIMDDNTDALPPWYFNEEDFGDEDPDHWRYASMEWHEAAFVAWDATCKHRELPVSTLKYIIIPTELEISTMSHTYNVIYWAREHSKDPWQTVWSAEYSDPSDELFQTLLGTPIGEDVAKFLTTYADQLATREGSILDQKVTKVKWISSIIIATDESALARAKAASNPGAVDITQRLGVAFVLEDIDPPTGDAPFPPKPSPSSRMPARQSNAASIAPGLASDSLAMMRSEEPTAAPISRQLSSIRRLPRPSNLLDKITGSSMEDADDANDEWSAR